MATFNGTEPRAAGPSFPIMPAGLTELERWVWRELELRKLPPEREVSDGSKRAIAQVVGSTGGVVGAVLASIRRKLRIEPPAETATEPAREPGEALTGGTPAEAAHDLELAHVPELETEAPDPDAPDASALRIAELEAAVGRLMDQREALRESRDACQRERDEARVERQAALERLAAAREREAKAPALTAEHRRLALALAAGGEACDPSTWVEVLRRAADAVEAVLS